MSYLFKKAIKDGWSVKIVSNADRPERVTTRKEWEALSERAVAASVPGDWILDYVKEGIFPDPYFGDNYLKFMEYERHHVFYSTTFVFDEEPDENTYLRLEGVDTVADIYLNGEKIGHVENMFIEHEIRATGIKKGENQLIVHLLPVCLEARKYDIGSAPAAHKYNVESLVIRKAAHSFGWDICPRIVGGGIWKPVYVIKKRPRRIKNVHIVTNGFEFAKTAKLAMTYDVEIGEDDVREYELKVEGRCGASYFSAREQLWFTHGKKEIFVISPKLWWIRGYGKPNLYDVTVTLLRNGKEEDAITFRYGIRTVELVSDPVTSEEKRGEFAFFINGKKVYIQGTNWVPCDAFHSRDAERMPAIFDLVWDSGCNAVRVWGGNVYESDAFYDKCDEKGIFVWQDFMMACAIYPRTDRMITQLSEEVRSVVRRLNNHPSVCLWAGDNECDVAYMNWFGGGKDPKDNVLTRRIIPDLLQEEDGSRPYLPSSPYMSPEAVEKKMNAPEQHLWGPRKYFKGKFYRDNDATFASEIGYHGCSSVQSIEKFIPKEYLWGYKNNKMWIYHAASPELKGPFTYRIRLMARQIGYFFGEKPLTLEKFSQMSQVVQAEAKKYFVESFRCRMGTKTGLIWWNVMDCWPQFSDAVVDYYFDKKLAYYYIKNSQQPLCLMMDKDDKGKLRLFAVSDLDEDKKIEYTVTVDGKKAAEGRAVAEAGRSVEIARIKGRGRKFFVITWKTEDGKEGKNHFLLGRPFFAYTWYVRQMEKSGLMEWLLKVTIDRRKK